METSTLSSKPLKLLDQFTYLGSNISLAERDVKKRIGKTWSDIEWFSIIWKSDL